MLLLRKSVIKGSVFLCWIMLCAWVNRRLSVNIPLSLSFRKGLQLPALLLDPSGCFFFGVIAPQGSKVLKGLEPGKVQIKHLYMITFLVFFCPSFFLGKKAKILILTDI